MLIAGNKEQKKKYLGRLLEEPLVAVSTDRVILPFMCMLLQLNMIFVTFRRMV